MRARILAAVLAVAPLAAWSAAPEAVAASPRRLTVSTEWLAERLSDPRYVILQVGDKAGYDAGHIPGARFVTLADISAPMGGDALILELPDAETLRGRLQALGITDRSRIVVVPTKEGFQSATRVAFTLQAAGLGPRTVLLDGGLPAWIAEGRPLSKEAPAVAQGRLSPLKMRPLVVDADFVRRRLRDGNYAVVDARTPEFYAGTRTGGSPTRPHKTGHIAGAKNVPFNAVTTADLKLASPEEIKARFRAAGVKPGDTVIAYCHVGQQATATLFAARALGLDVRLYDGSFEEWSRLDGPVETAN